MNTENSNPNNGSAWAKIITIIGLFGIIILLAWSAIQIVKLFPSAINSLASLADSVYSYKPDAKAEKITINADRAIMNNGETLAIWWDNKNESGKYTFSYSCQDGIAIDMRSSGKDFVSINCGKDFELGLTDRIEIKIDSEKSRFTQVTYTISYFKKNSDVADGTETKTISVINPKLEEKPNTDTVTKPTTTTKPKPVTTSEKPIVTKPTETVPIYTYEIPVSNPKGYTDLLVSDLKVGTTVNGIFVDTDHIVKNKDGAIQFVVHNIGNKTSETWTFITKLPNKLDYTSSEQSPLKPNERAIITVSFPATTDIDLQKINVLVKTDSDKNKNNNYADKTVIVLQ